MNAAETPSRTTAVCGLTETVYGNSNLPPHLEAQTVVPWLYAAASLFAFQGLLRAALVQTRLSLKLRLWAALVVGRLGLMLLFSVQRAASAADLLATMKDFPGILQLSPLRLINRAYELTHSPAMLR